MVHGLALHVGEVAYGNVGAPHRLDLTVIGPAVNRARRLLDLAKRLDQQVLVSQALAREVSQPLVDLGRYQLRDVERPQGFLHCPTKAVLDRTNRHTKASPSAQYLLTEPTFHSLLDRLLWVKLSL